MSLSTVNDRKSSGKFYAVTNCIVANKSHVILFSLEAIQPLIVHCQTSLIDFQTVLSWYSFTESLDSKKTVGPEKT